MQADSRIAPARTWDELKAELQSRADRQVYPLTGMPAEDVRAALNAISSLDRDEWGRGWSAVGKRHAAAAQSLEATDKAKAADAYLMAWRFFGFGAWPTQNSPQKKTAYELCLAAFRDYCRLKSPPVETVRIPFEGSEIVCYLALPPGKRPAPIIITIGGLDSYKEYTAERYGTVYMAHGIGFLAIDAPGTGEAPVKAGIDSERMYSAVIDYLLTRSDIDAKRIALQGVSTGGYWSTKVAYKESARLCAVVNWAGPVHYFFAEKEQLKTYGTREYLFDFAPATFGMYGVDNIDDGLKAAARMSLKDQGLLDNPTPPFLLLNGEKDTVAPIEDLHIVLRNGPTPKTAWVNPIGIHLARSKDWNDERIMSEIIMPWFLMQMR